METEISIKEYPYNKTPIVNWDYKKSFDNIIDNIYRFKIANNLDTKDARKIIESFVKQDNLRKLSSVIPILNPPWFTKNQIPPSVILDAIEEFNKTIPRGGVWADWETNESQGPGSIWELIFDYNVFSVRLTMEKPKVTAPAIRMNGTRKIKKSNGELISLNIERIYTVDKKGMEITLHSIV